MSKILNAVKGKFNILKKNAMLRTVLISVFALLLIFSVTLAWYINKVGLWGMEFNTGNIEFNTYVFAEDGKHLAGPVSSADEDESKYMNAPLMTLNNAQVGSTGTAYIVVESTGSLGIQYRIAFDITGRNDKSTAYLGGYKYNISKVTDKVTFNGASNLDVTRCPRPEKINDEIVTIDRNAVNGTIEDLNGYEVYRVDYTLVHKNEEYTGNSINIYFNIFATQIGGDFEDTAERGYTYYCSTREDIDRARVEAYPGDIIKLSADITYYGDLVFNKPVSLETNDFTLTVNGNLMYDYVLGNSLKLDAGGLGTVIVQCTKEGVGGNLQIKAPISEVTLVGANSSNGDFIVEKNITVDATNAFGSAGVSFNNVRIVDLRNSRKTIQLESNTRATVSFGTTIGLFQSVVKASNIEIINNGIIGEINLSNMYLLEQTNSPQIYILNNNDINQPIILPTWSVKFVEDASGKCSGNTRIIQSYSGSFTEVTGNCAFTTADVQVERKEYLVEQIEENNDSRLKIYYQDVNGETTTIQSILENYLNNVATTGCALNEVLELEIISIGDKAVTAADIAFMNSTNMLALRQLDLQRANVYDSATDKYHRLPDNAFNSVSKYEELVLPQNLVEIGANAFAKSHIESIVTVPSGVTVFGEKWFNNGRYVGFAASVPVAQAADGMTGVKAVFVSEAYIDSYKSVYSKFATQIYPMSVLDETKQHFVRNTLNDEWEITYYISGEEAVIGQNIIIDGRILKITSVYANAYRHNYVNAEVRFADTVENLGAYNFYSNQNVVSVDLNNIKNVGAEAFYTCPSLSQVNFGNALETIGVNAFFRCNNLAQDVVLPATMQSIGSGAFRYSKITSVNTGGTKRVDSMAFAACQSLIYAEMPYVSVVGDDGENLLFDSCSSLVSVRMPCLAKITGNKMFFNCKSLREFYLGTKDDAAAFTSDTFTGVNLNKLKLFVPEEHLEYFQTKRPGNVIATMVYPDGEKMGQELVNGFNIGTYIVRAIGNGTYSLVTSNIDHTGTLTIPEEFNGKPIVHIYANAFRNQSFTSVTLELGNALKSIGAYAFYNRSGLLTIDFGKSLETIEPYAFSHCSNLVQDVNLPASMRTIQNNAFARTAITGLNTGGTTLIEGSAFITCASLVHVTMPEVTAVAESGNNDIFASCTSLVSVNMPKLMRASGMRMFMGCTSLMEIYMGSDAADVSLGSGPFASMNSAKIKLFVPENLLSFYQQRNIINASQVYPAGEKIGSNSVNGYVVGDYIVLDRGDEYTLVTSHLHFSGEVVVPDVYNNKPITEIYTNAFYNQTFTNTTLYLGDNVKVIGENAFYNRTGLKVVVMDQVTTVGVGAFYQSGLQIVNGPKITSIANNAFRKCTSLEMVNLPLISAIEGTAVFTDCTSLKSVYFENIMSVHSTTFSNDKKLEKITINRAIKDDRSNMPATMTIESAAPCKIYVPYRSLSAYSSTWSGKPVVSFDLTATYNGETYILADNNGRYALIDYIPTQTVTTMSVPAALSSSLGTVTISSIEPGAFSAVAETLKNLTLCASITQLSGSALSECVVLQNIYVSPNSKHFVSVSGVLYSKDAKMLVKFPAGRSGSFNMTASNYASTVGIASSAFENVTGLTEIIFPANLMVIDSTAFKGCTNLKTVRFTGTTPPVLLGSGIFDTRVDEFKMIIPTSDATVVSAYLCAYNFAEYEAYIDLNGNSAPAASANRNQVSLGG